VFALPGRARGRRETTSRVSRLPVLPEVSIGRFVPSEGEALLPLRRRCFKLPTQPLAAPITVIPVHRWECEAGVLARLPPSLFPGHAPRRCGHPGYAKSLRRSHEELYR
jgi:hypothetical protein